MKKFFIVFAIFSCLLAFVSCAKNARVSDPDLFRTKTGVIGVFRQSAFYCNEESPQFIQLGDSIVRVKPAWNPDQDNLFVTEHKTGIAILRSYRYFCGEDEHKFILDTTKKDGAIGIVIPNSGFCKIAISFSKGDDLFSQNENLLREYFKKENVAIAFNQVPYCDIVDNQGRKIVRINKDSLLQSQFQAAIADATEALESEIRPLVKINDDSEYVSWNSNKDNVMMLTFHNRPDLYEEGKNFVLNKEVWVVSEKELFSWYLKNKEGVKDWGLRFKQLLGIPHDFKATHFSAMWVKPKDLIRPAYVTDIASDSMRTSFDESFDDYSSDKEFKVSYKKWFEKNRSKSYLKQGGYPWTRLGYTYDWGSSGEKYGLSEFLVFKDSEVKVIFTKNVKSFLNWLEDKNLP